MSHGRTPRRVPMGRVAIVFTLVLFAGCQRPQVRRIDPLPASPIPPASASEVVPVAATPPPLPQPAPATPLLDSLSARDEALKRASLESLTEPESKPEPSAEPEPAPLPVAAAPPAIKPDPPIEPRDVWRDGLAELHAFALEHASDSSADWPLRVRLLDELNDSAEDGDLWRTVLKPLVFPTKTTTSAAVRAAVDALEERAPLEITDLRLCRKVHSFGNFETFENETCKAGHPLIVYFEVSGLRYEPALGGMLQSRLSSKIEIVPADGGPAVWSEDLGAADDLCRQRRRDYFVNYRVTFPKTLAPGRYVLQLTQTDELARHDATRTLPFAIAP